VMYDIYKILMGISGLAEMEQRLNN